MFNNKFLQRFVALSPLIFVFLMILSYIFFMGITLVGASHPPKSEFFYIGLGVFVITVILASIVSIFSLVFYVIHALKNPNLEQNNSKIPWILVIVLVNGLGTLIYWIAEVEFKKPRPIVK